MQAILLYIQLISNIHYVIRKRNLDESLSQATFCEKLVES